MQRYLILVLIATFMVMSSGCEPIETPEYTYIPPEAKADKSCAIRCMSAKGACENICRMKNPRCFMREEQDALYRFNLYRREVRESGESMSKSFRSFIHRDKCLGSCQCTASFNTCYWACGGQVIRRHQVKKASR